MMGYMASNRNIQFPNQQIHLPSMDKIKTWWKWLINTTKTAIWGSPIVYCSYMSYLHFTLNIDFKVYFEVPKNWNIWVFLHSYSVVLLLGTQKCRSWKFLEIFAHYLTDQNLKYISVLNCVKVKCGGVHCYILRGHNLTL